MSSRKQRLARLGIGDLTTLWVERATSPMQIGLAAVFDAPEWLDPAGRLRLDWLTAQLNIRSAAVPALRMRIRPTRAGEGRPIWIDDAEFDIARHVNSVELGPAVNEAAFLAWAAQSYLAPVDRAHPLWRATLVPGLPGGRVGLLLVIHHVAVDGLAGVAALTALLDSATDANARSPAWHARPGPTGWRLMADNLATTLRTLPPAVRGLPQLAHAISTTGTALHGNTPVTDLTGPVSDDRRIASGASRGG